MCPKGDDARTQRQLRYVVQLTIGNTDSAEALSGSYIINFAGHNTTSLSAPGDVTTAADLSSALEALEPIENATVTQDAVDGTTKGTRYTIVLDFAPFGQNNIYAFDSQPDVNLFTCIDDGVDSAITGLFICHFEIPTLTVRVSPIHQSNARVSVAMLPGLTRSECCRCCRCLPGVAQ